MQKRIVSPLMQYFFSSNMANEVGCIEGELSKTIVLPISSVQPNFQMYFNDDPSLDNAIIKSIEVVDSSTMSIAVKNGVSYDPLNIDYAGGILVLQNKKHELLCTLGLYTMIRRLNSGKATLTYFKDIDWSSSYVYFPNVGTITTSNAVVLRVYYDYNFNSK